MLNPHNDVHQWTLTHEQTRIGQPTKSTGPAQIGTDIKKDSKTQRYLHDFIIINNLILGEFFLTSISWRSFTGVWVTTSLLRFPDGLGFFFDF